MITGQLYTYRSVFTFYWRKRFVLWYFSVIIREDRMS